MRISDWSSDVCSSDLQHGLDELRTVSDAQAIQGFSARVGAGDARGEPRPRLPQQLQGHPLRARDAERNGGALRVRMLRHEPPPYSALFLEGGSRRGATFYPDLLRSARRYRRAPGRDRKSVV